MDPPQAIRGLVRGLHHVAIAVERIDAVRPLYEGALGMVAGEVEPVPSQGVNVLVLHAGETRVEIVEPMGDDSPITRFLQRRGSGLHHLAWRVDSVSEAIAELRRRNVRLIDHEPKPGSHGTTIAFVHPSATAGVLMELVEDPAS